MRQAKAPADLIAAAATPPGASGISVIRISGSGAPDLAKKILQGGAPPPPRMAARRRFVDAGGGVIDDGICIFFRAPRSFTGQDMLELQGHGGGAVQNAVLARCYELGARPAEPGEFTLRAYLNGKIDLAQAEAVADLIGAGSEAAARAAARALGGEFSRRATSLAASMDSLRADMEAALDFADEDTGEDASCAARLEQIESEAAAFLRECEQGAKLASGACAVIAGRPNVGKSSLLNRLCMENAAIVSAAAGTTRDPVSRDIILGGLPVRLTDTAGVRNSPGEIEREGISRALSAAQDADVLILVDDGENETNAGEQPQIPAYGEIVRVRNKTDLLNVPAGWRGDILHISAKTGEGMDALRDAIAKAAGSGESDAAPFTARARHVEALRECLRHLGSAREHAAQPELAAAWLSSARDAASSLTGGFDDEALLGEIFSRFCIGK